MPIKLPARRLCGTAEAARIYGCSQRHLRKLADHGEIWSERISSRTILYDADEIDRLAHQREKLRQAGKLCGRRPGGRASA